MDPRLVEAYEHELEYLNDLSVEFARNYPKIASRLDHNGFTFTDPYVERLIEGCAFLAARVQLRMDAEFPRLTQHLLEVVYPDYLAPTPSMTVVQFVPDLDEGSLAEGFRIARAVPRADRPMHDPEGCPGILRTESSKLLPTPCEFRTAMNVDLWPLEIESFEYCSRGVATSDVPDVVPYNALIRLRLRCTAGLRFEELRLKELPLFLTGTDQIPYRLYELLVGATTAVAARPTSDPGGYTVIARGPLRRLGFEDEESLLPYGARSFHGYRILHEYFAFPPRFLFVRLEGLDRAAAHTAGSELEILMFLDRADPQLEGVVTPQNIKLFCSPAINLFPKTLDRIHLDTRAIESHVIPDRNRPLDYEVHSVLEVVGYGSGDEMQQEFVPLYAAQDPAKHDARGSYYVLRREQRRLSEKEGRGRARSTYVGSEAYISVVDLDETPVSLNLKQLAVRALCTNRDLPGLLRDAGRGRPDFVLTASAPVRRVQPIAETTEPRASHANGQMAWRLISHLALNYLALVNADERKGAEALRDLLRLYANLADPSVAKQIDGVRSVQTRPIVRRMSTAFPLTYGRGLEITVELDEMAFTGSGCFLLGAVLENFFARFVAINSFTETNVQSTTRGVVARWPMRTGRRPVL